MLKYQQIDTAANPDHAIIMLHGLGANSSDFSFLPNYLKLNCKLRFIFPDAPIIPITINNNYPMQAWYDILSMTDLSREVDLAGIEDSVSQIEQLIDILIESGIIAQNILIAGFSQGGVISYYTFINSQKKLAGAIILSSYLPSVKIINQENLKQKLQLPVLINHGLLDNVVNYQYGYQAYSELSKLGFERLTWKEYKMGHEVIETQLHEINQFINKVFS